jgi:hypothetical protein
MRTWSTLGLAACLLPVFGACASHRFPDNKKSVQIAINLTAVAAGCKAHVDPETATVYNRTVITLTVTDNCNQELDEEKETQIVFRYAPHTKRKWLDPKTFISRTPKKGARGQIVYVAHRRGQPKGAEASYVVIYDGHEIADPKVVWGD